MKNSSYFYAKVGQKLKMSIGTEKLGFDTNYVGNPIDLPERQGSRGFEAKGMGWDCEIWNTRCHWLSSQQ